MFSDKKKNEIDENEEGWGGGGGDIWKWGDMSLNFEKKWRGRMAFNKLGQPPFPLTHFNDASFSLYNDCLYGFLFL